MKIKLLFFLLLPLVSFAQVTVTGFTASTALKHGSNLLVAPVVSSTIASPTAISLTWTAPPNATSYTLQRATDNMFTANLTNLSSNQS